MKFKVELHWSESDIAWSEYIYLPVVCLNQVALSGDKDQKTFLLSRSLQYNSALRLKFILPYWIESRVKWVIDPFAWNFIFQYKIPAISMEMSVTG